MSSLLIKNGLIVTMDKDRRVIPDGSVAVEDGRVVSLRRGTPGKGKHEEVIDARGKIVLPGLVCAHTHLYRIFLRDAPLIAESPTDLSQLMQRLRWPVEEAMTKEDAYTSALFSCLRLMKSGITFFADTFSGPNVVRGVLDRIASAIERSGVRGIIGFEATERRTHTEGARGAMENERFIKRIKKERTSFVQGMFCIGASFTVSDELFRFVRELASRYKAPMSVHVSEGLIDVYHNYEHYGKRTIERLNDIGILAPDVVLAHCVHVNDDELEIIKKRGAGVAHNPMSDMLGGAGIAPVAKMLSMGIPVGLGNDGYVFDGFENIRVASLLQKVACGNPQVISPSEALEIATIRGAELYGLQNELGSIEHGKLADMIIIDPAQTPAPLHSGSVAPYLVNGVSGSDVETVIVGGRVVVREGKVQTVDEAEVARVARKSVEKLWEKLGLTRR
jgi:cytosine/adenosine deaminase-related metal-dependent hydrolase